ncbi:MULTISPECIES: DUF4250 domain-containing protein [unclassified Agarivorans]|uniref:DUF4250 domain-containing protein n=1 Tax=unclassified Agarivorans TaxID=2636026 RepID=UPI0010DBD6D9|nr:MULTISPECIES: DUF4250 domain-containing protein [unclassified Agarivorans]MDO6685164.1 DUF4250 domain-containing protein [Agarivorans sp. 3_MG-2023]MDO6715664.1 DUF4250 domain-containing protein [Agarivorans sp. 2_MG-2023]MDO6763815.1 DUF4250 domain-containing protein [Agarivorans sp. 1_MG-2023]GDY27070.1 hypothetical protein AHAT_29600 [Agarivorans sp. Toyoura001]
MLDQNRVQTMDINILLSIINMQVRNDFSSFEELCHFYELNQNQLVQRLALAGYTLQANQQFTAA